MLSRGEDCGELPCWYFLVGLRMDRDIKNIVKVWDSQCSESMYLYAEWTPGCVSYVGGKT